MVKRMLSAMILILAVFSPQMAKSNLYLGVGGSYLMPRTHYEENNKESMGFKLEVMQKNYCKLWYGLRFDYFSLKETDPLLPYYETEAKISPVVKWAPFTKNCYDWKLIPYLEGMFSVSSISGTDKLGKLGLGGAIGAGLSWNFKLFDHCWMLDADALYSAPNFIMRDDNRENLQSINVGLTLSIGL